jgi:soluble epoxide hydrolase/lipid-phosphate phosphatase
VKRETAGSTSYLVDGPDDGPLMIFVHGWPANARTWLPQLEAFAAQGYRTVAPDMRGYGQSARPAAPKAYAQRHIVRDMLNLLDHLGRDRALWIGHDWGSPTVWNLAAHHPDRCVGVASLCIPYRTAERGPDEMLPYVNREIYPADLYPYAQFDYMKYYERHPDRVTELFDNNPANTINALYRSGTPAFFIARTATVTRDGGWFGGATTVPEFPRDDRVLDQETFDELRISFETNGFATATNYYLNHADNLAYSNEAPTPRLDMPVLFIEARFDPIPDIGRSRLAEPMREHCTDLTEIAFDAGHWVALERADDVNAAIAGWASRLAA